MLVCTTLLGQLAFAPPERMAMNSLQKKHWDKARAQLAKALKKDTLNASARYVLACYFLDAANPAHNLDSAHVQTGLAMADFNRADSRGRERLKRFPLDSAILVNLSQRVDSAAFEKARQQNTEQAYLHFLAIFTSAAQRDQATELRDEVAYLDALRENTYTAFAAFLEKYPASSRAPDAKTRYERALYQTKTRSRRLADYEAFLRDYPATAYRREAERHVFELATATGTPAAFESFLKKYPQSTAFQQARDMLYYLLLERGAEQTLATGWNDSLRQAHTLGKKYLVPFYKDGRYGFIDQAGRDAIAPIAATLDPAYDCGNITDDLLLIGDRILTKNNISRGNGKALEDLGFGFVRAETDHGLRLLHKAAGTILESTGNVRLLDGRFIAVQSGNLWSLLTLCGRKLNSGTWEDISTLGDLLVLHRGGKQWLAPAAMLSAEPDAPVPTLTGPFDAVEAWPHHRIWVAADGQEGVRDAELNEVVRMGEHNLQAIPAGTLAVSASGSSFFTTAGQSVYFQRALHNSSWTAVRNRRWRLYEPATGTYLSPAYDTLVLTGPFAIGHRGDSAAVYFSPAAPPEVFTATTPIEFMPGKDSTAFLVATAGEKKTVFNRAGRKLFTLACDEVTHAGGDAFIFTRKDRSKKEHKGLVDRDGRQLLPPVYDAIGSVSNGVVSLLKDRKFGLFDVQHERQIKPAYDKNVNVYSQGYLTAYQNGKYGFMQWDNKPSGTFEFDEIRYWNDSVSWVRKNYQWMLYHIRKQKIVEAHIAAYTLVADAPGEKIAIISQEGHYGVMSNTRGEVIPATLSRIVNVGSADHPMYLTAKHVEEASIYVVIYYDQNGTVLRRQVYEEEDYEKVRCLSSKD